MYKEIKDNLKEQEELFEMANLSPKRTGLKLSIWSDGAGKFRNKSDKRPRIKVGKNDTLIASISLDDSLEILAKSKGLKQHDLKAIEEAKEYIKENLDLFIKHYNSHSKDYDDDDLKNDLIKRGYYTK